MTEILTRSLVDVGCELMLRDEGREVYGRIVPFGVPAHVVEPDGQGGVDEYDEEFVRGCTEAMRRPPNWIRLTLDHDRSMDSWIGQCTQLDETDDGAYGTFKLHPTAHLDKVRSILVESHTGLSIEFHDRAKSRRTGPLRRRHSIHVHAVSATPIPVYPEASILAMRSGFDTLGSSTPRLDAVRQLLASP